MAWENALGSVGGLAAGFGGLVEGHQQNELNKQVFEYNKDLNALKMSREDNAVQRRAADLQAAGLSKTLAAGSPASASAGESLQAPRLTKFDKFAQGLQLGQAVTDIMAAGAKADLNRAQAEGIRMENKLRDQQIANMVTQGDFDRLLYDYAAVHDMKMPTANIWVGLFNRAIDLIFKHKPPAQGRNLTPAEEAAYAEELRGAGIDPAKVKPFSDPYYRISENLHPVAFSGSSAAPQPVAEPKRDWIDKRAAKAELNFLRDKALHPESYVSKKSVDAHRAGLHPYAQKYEDWYAGSTAYDKSDLGFGFGSMDKYMADPDFSKWVQDLINGLSKVLPMFIPTGVMQYLPVGY